MSEPIKSESNKKKGINEPYDSKSCKRKCTKSATPKTVVSEQDHFADYKFSKGVTVAISYSDGWYPGQVEEVLDYREVPTSFKFKANCVSLACKR